LRCTLLLVTSHSAATRSLCMTNVMNYGIYSEEQKISRNKGSYGGECQVYRLQNIYWITNNSCYDTIMCKKSKKVLHRYAYIHTERRMLPIKKCVKTTLVQYTRRCSVLAVISNVKNSLLQICLYTPLF
jgi:hypothetical protein